MKDCKVQTFDDRRAVSEELPPVERIDATIQLVEKYERRMESELRKPEKDWNYSPEKIAIAPHNNATRRTVGHL